MHLPSEPHLYPCAALLTLELKDKVDGALQLFTAGCFKDPTLCGIQRNGPEYDLTSNKLSRLDFTVSPDRDRHRDRALELISLSHLWIWGLDALDGKSFDVMFVGAVLGSCRARFIQWKDANTNG